MAVAGNLAQDKAVKFSGRKADYPMYHQALIRNYEQFTETEPSTLLNNIQCTCVGEALEQIRHTFTLPNPRQSLSDIWTTLEEVFGDPHAIMRELIRKIVRKERSLPVEEEKLLKYRSQMREVRYWHSKNRC